MSRRRGEWGRFALAAALLCPVVPARAVPPAPGGRYVAMGSSFAAGPGIGMPDAASGACARSRSNYARIVAERFRLALADVSCSGAETADILGRRQFGFPPQIEAVTADTALVTVLIGGNDLFYMGNLFGLSCRDTGGTGCPILPDAEVERRFAALPGSLHAVLAAVRRRAPAARVVMVGYLPVLPADGTKPCSGVPLTDADAHRMRAVATRLGRVIAAVAADTGTELVPAAAIGAGHDACAADPFMAGWRPPVTPGWPRPVAYHPNQAAMDRIAGALEAVLER
ncbi:MAG: SGNH/GDSL hydrolase family protein [Gluconacetobacter diazotrophicus]|nr:SGNH/GDSL hydrolase family protein [Gluconacetobacter diazotrophicus]